MANGSRHRPALLAPAVMGFLAQDQKGHGYGRGERAAMGFDTSFHPVDLPLIQGRILPYIQGRGEIDDLIEEAARLAHVRFRANAWGLGAKGRSQVDPFLHIWGRPFFITTEPPIGAAIDRWQQAKSDQQADQIGVEMTGPGCQPKLDGKFPAPEDLRRGLRLKVDILRQCHAALSAGHTTVEMPQGETKNAAEVLASSLAHAVLELSAHLRPGWMDRGFWPSQIFAKEFSPHSPLLGDFPGSLPQVQFRPTRTIESNYSVGGWLEPDRVAWMRGRLEELKEPILEQTGVGATSLEKLIEALADAEQRGLPFCEASEIYSGPMGIMN